MEKLKDLLQSRKFWSLVASLVTIGTAAYANSITIPEAINATVAALAAYSIGTAIAG